MTIDHEQDAVCGCRIAVRMAHYPATPEHQWVNRLEILIPCTQHGGGPK